MAQAAIAQQTAAAITPQSDVIGDPWYPYQWHLENTGKEPEQKGTEPGEDINIRRSGEFSVWQRYKGEGMYISIVDGDIDFDDADLKDNLSVELSRDFYPNTTGSQSHATNVASAAAARDNEIDSRGVAPRATIYSLNLLGNSSGNGASLSNDTTADAMTQHTTITAVSNNSWGPTDPFGTVRW